MNRFFSLKIRIKRQLRKDLKEMESSGMYGVKGIAFQANVPDVF